MLKLEKILITLFVFLVIFFGYNRIAMAGECPTDNGFVGCDPNTPYFCTKNCRSASLVPQCPIFSSGDYSCDPNAPGCGVGCTSADDCGICASCDSDYYLLCSQTNGAGRNCAPRGTAQGSQVSSYCTSCTYTYSGGNYTYTCTGCRPGYVKNGSQCDQAVLKLGPDSVSGNSIVQSVANTLMYINGDQVNIGTSSFATGIKLYLYDVASGPIIALSGLDSNYRGLTIKNTNDIEQWFIGNNASNNFVIRATGSNDILTVNASTSNVGIGTTTSDAKLDVNGSLAVRGSVSFTGPLYTGTGSRLLMVDSSGNVSATSTLSGISMPSGTLGQTLRYGASGWEATSIIYIKNDGNVGIGTTTPDAKLHIVSKAGANYHALQIDNQSGEYPGFRYYTTSRRKGDYTPNNVLFEDARSDTDGTVGSFFTIYRSSALSKGNILQVGNTTAANSLVVSNTGYVGIGTASPSASLTVNGNAIANPPTDSGHLATKGYVDSAIQKLWINSSNYLYASSTSWDVGIGTTTPGAKLDVNGSLAVRGAVSFTNFLYTGSNRLLMVDSDGNVSATTTLAGVSMPSGNAGQTLRYGASGWEATSTIYIKNDGNVGIGDILSTNKLSVSGNIAGSGDLSISGGGTISGNLGIGSMPSYSNITFSRYVDMTGVNHVAYLARSQSVVAAMLAGENGNPAGANFGYAGEQMTLGTISNHPLNFITNGGSKMFLSNNGKLGIGTTSPAAALHIYPQTDTEGLRVVSSNYSPLVIVNSSSVDLFRVDETGRARSNAYCDINGANCFNPSSGWSSNSYFATITSSTYSGNNNDNPGYDQAHSLCNAQLAGSHVCSAEEILNTIRDNKPLPSVDVWIFNGPPGYTAAANDCEARSTNSGDSKYGAYWQASTTDNIKGRGLLAYCSSKLNLACCH